MKSKSAIVRKVLLALAPVVVAVLIAVGYGWRQMQKAATFSCVSSVAAALSYGQRSNTGATSEKWHRFADGELAELLGSESGFDCARSSRPFADVWNHDLRAAVLRHQDGKLEFIVWSVGPDGRSNTPDDIVVPYGEKVPIQ